RLPLRGSTRRLELLLQLVPLALEPVAFSLQTVAILAQPFELALQPLVLFPQPLLLAPLLTDPPLEVPPRRVRQPPPNRHGRIQAWDAKRSRDRRGSLHANGANQRPLVFLQANFGLMARWCATRIETGTAIERLQQVTLLQRAERERALRPVREAAGDGERRAPPGE